ncbi:hypothetical protein AYI70_g4891 [Smittium culicis]|uniref:Uncharacterized protein n=1 Tax=Smittium culicis TaxID=133412 RepID=A0A1R1XX94_9FUNG|nr:hypothetical protein AYI70_g7895 [Smittium culicis]OMJ19176.1 hypothetical protein AYI70_g4891 [Smittium culicis]
MSAFSKFKRSFSSIRSKSFRRPSSESEISFSYSHSILDFPDLLNYSDLDLIFSNDYNPILNKFGIGLFNLGDGINTPFRPLDYTLWSLLEFISVYLPGTILSSAFYSLKNEIILHLERVSGFLQIYTYLEKLNNLEKRISLVNNQKHELDYGYLFNQTKASVSNFTATDFSGNISRFDLFGLTSMGNVSEPSLYQPKESTNKKDNKMFPQDIPSNSLIDNKMRKISKSLKRAKSVLFNACTEDNYSPASATFSHNKSNNESIQIPNPTDVPQTEFTINIIDEEEHKKSVCINVKDFSSENKPTISHNSLNNDFHGFRFPENESSLEKKKFNNSNISKCKIYEPSNFKDINENSQDQIDNNADAPHVSLLLDGNGVHSSYLSSSDLSISSHHVLDPLKKCENDNLKYKQDESGYSYNRPKCDSFLEKVKKRISRTSKLSFFLNEDDFCTQKPVESDTSCDQSLFEFSEYPNQNRELYDFSLDTNITHIDSDDCIINRSRSEEYLDNFCISKYDFNDTIRASTIECDQVSLIINAKSDIGISQKPNKPKKYKPYTLFEIYKELMAKKTFYSSINSIDNENGNLYSIFGECRPEYNALLSEKTFEKILLKESYYAKTDSTNEYRQNDSILDLTANVPALIVTDNQEIEKIDPKYSEFDNYFLPIDSNSKSMEHNSLMSAPKRNSFHIRSFSKINKSRSEPVSLDDKNDCYFNSPKTRTSVNEIGLDRREDYSTNTFNDTKFKKIKRSISFIFLKNGIGKSHKDDTIKESDEILSNAENNSNRKEDEAIPYIYIQMNKKSFTEMVQSMKVVKDSIDRLNVKFSSDDNNFFDKGHDLESFSLQEDTNVNATTSSANDVSTFWLTAENFPEKNGSPILNNSSSLQRLSIKSNLSNLSNSLTLNPNSSDLLSLYSNFSNNTSVSTLSKLPNKSKSCDNEKLSQRVYFTLKMIFEKANFDKDRNK